MCSKNFNFQIKVFLKYFVPFVRKANMIMIVARKFANKPLRKDLNVK